MPVRDDHVFGPTSSRSQSVSDESSWKYLCTKLMKTTFVFRRDWIKNKCLSEIDLIGPSNGVLYLLSWDNCPCVNLICMFRKEQNYSIASHHLLFLKSLTEPERSPHFLWFLIDLRLTYRDSIISSTTKIQRIICMNNVWILI